MYTLIVSIFFQGAISLTPVKASELRYDYPTLEACKIAAEDPRNNGPQYILNPANAAEWKSAVCVPKV